VLCNSEPVIDIDKTGILYLNFQVDLIRQEYINTTEFVPKLLPVLCGPAKFFTLHEKNVRR
jgi:hypothetical protein